MFSLFSCCRQELNLKRRTVKNVCVRIVFGWFFKSVFLILHVICAYIGAAQVRLQAYRVSCESRDVKRMTGSFSSVYSGSAVGFFQEAGEYLRAVNYNGRRGLRIAVLT